MRSLDTSGLRALGDERFGPWLTEDGSLLRAPTPRMPLATVEAARALADIYSMAANASVMAPSVREIVRVDDGFGVVVDYLPGRDLGVHIAARSWSPRRAGREMGQLQRSIHRISAKVGKDWKAQFCVWAQCLSPLVPARLGTRLVKLVQCIPERCDFLHGDLHPKNVIVSGGRLAVIDWERAGFGHPVFDLAITRSRLLFAMPRGFAQAGLPVRLGERVYRVVWDALLASYFEGAAKTELDELDRRIAILAEVEFSCFAYKIAKLGSMSPSERQHRRIDEATAALSDLLPRVRCLSF